MSSGGIFRSCAAHLVVELGEPEQFFGPMEGEDLPAAGVGLQEVGELRDRAGGLVGERQRQAVVRQAGGQAVEVLARLRFDAGERVALRLGLDHADGLAVGVEQVVGVAGVSGNSRTATPRARRDVHLAAVLHRPSRIVQAGGRCPAGLFLRGSSEKPGFSPPKVSLTA